MPKFLVSLLHLHINYCVQHRLVIQSELHQEVTSAIYQKDSSKLYQVIPLHWIISRYTTELYQVIPLNYIKLYHRIISRRHHWIIYQEATTLKKLLPIYCPVISCKFYRVLSKEILQERFYWVLSKEIWYYTPENSRDIIKIFLITQQDLESWSLSGSTEQSFAGPTYLQLHRLALQESTQASTSPSRTTQNKTFIQIIEYFANLASGNPWF